MTPKSDIRKTIRSHHGSLSKNHQKISTFLLNNFERIPFMNVHEIAAASQASTATVVRFSQRVGFSGFSELRDAFTLLLQQNLTRDKPLIKSIENDMLVAVAEQDMADINKTRKQIDRSVFNNIIDCILAAREIGVAGVGISCLSSQILAYQLNQVGIPARALIHGSATFPEQIILMDPGALLILFSYPPYSRETIEAARFARQRGQTVIAITNKPAAPITFVATQSMTATSENVLYTNSLAGITYIINAIATECAYRERGRAETVIQALEQFTAEPENSNHEQVL